MIERYARRNTESTYYNILEVMVLLLIDRYYDAVTRIGLFDRESQSYRGGKLFWYTIMLIMAIGLFLPFYVASIMYIINSVK